MSRTLFHFSQNSGPVAVPQTIHVEAADHHTHAIEPELLGARPRTAYWTTSTVLWRRWLWNLMFGSALLLLFLGRNDIATWDALITRGAPVTASVYEKHVSRGKSTSYNLRYTFYGDGILCYGTDRVSRAEFEAANIGDTIPVIYLPGSRGEKWQQGAASYAQREKRLWQWLLGGLFTVAGFAVGIAAFEHSNRRQMNLLRNGIATVGKVVSGNITTHKNSKTYTIQYEYKTSEWGGSRKSACVPKAMYEQHTQGNPYLTVVYDSEKFGDSAPYSQLNAAVLAGRS